MTTPAYGFGTQPAGTTSGGIGTPLGLPLPGTTYESVADLVAARGFDTATFDYSIDTETTAAPHDSLDPLAQRVFLLLSTRKGRLPFARPVGNDFFNLTRRDVDIERFGPVFVAQALAGPIAEGLVEVESVAVQTDGGAAYLIVSWIDKKRRQLRSTRSAL